MKKAAQRTKKRVTARSRGQRYDKNKWETLYVYIDEGHREEGGRSGKRVAIRIKRDEPFGRQFIAALNSKRCPDVLNRTTVRVYLEDRDLSGINFDRFILCGHFLRCNLDKTVFDDCVLSQLDFFDSPMHGTILNHCEGVLIPHGSTPRSLHASNIDSTLYLRSEKPVSVTCLGGTHAIKVTPEFKEVPGTYLPMFCPWEVTYGIPETVESGDDAGLSEAQQPVREELRVDIGCQSKTIPEWDAWFSDPNAFITTERSDPNFTRIRAMYAAMRAYLVTLGLHTDKKPKRSRAKKNEVTDCPDW